MRCGSPLESLHKAMAHAQYVALQGARFFERDFSVKLTEAQRRECIAREQAGGEKEMHLIWPGAYAQRRPNFDEISVFGMFVQTWGSTALGFGGMGGAAMTPAYTVVLRGPGRDLVVYFGGNFAYRIPAEVGVDSAEESSQASCPRAAFLADLGKSWLVSVAQAAERYGAIASPASE